MEFFVAHESYNFQNFALTLAGFESLTLQSFDFERSAEIEANFGKGGEIVSYGIKSFKSTAKATILMEELEKMVLMATPWGGDITKIPPFPIIGTSTPEGRTPMKLICPMVRCTKWNFGMKQGDTKTEVPLELFVLQPPIITFA